MIDILAEFQTSKLSGQNATLCLITNTQGSTPRKIGSKMLVFADGTSMTNPSINKVKAHLGIS